MLRGVVSLIKMISEQYASVVLTSLKFIYLISGAADSEEFQGHVYRGGRFFV